MSPYFVVPSVLFVVLPSDSEASLTSFGTASRDVFPRRASLFVFPRHASAEGPLASLGVTKSRLGVTHGGLHKFLKQPQRGAFKIQQKGRIKG